MSLDKFTAAHDDSQRLISQARLSMRAAACVLAVFGALICDARASAHPRARRGDRRKPRQADLTAGSRSRRACADPASQPGSPRVVARSQCDRDVGQKRRRRPLARHDRRSERQRARVSNRRRQPARRLGNRLSQRQPGLDVDGVARAAGDARGPTTNVTSDGFQREVCHPVENIGYYVDRDLVSDFVTPYYFQVGSKGPWDYLD
jgi:hypothetical protein